MCHKHKLYERRKFLKARGNFLSIFFSISDRDKLLVESGVGHWITEYAHSTFESPSNAVILPLVLHQTQIKRGDGHQSCSFREQKGRQTRIHLPSSSSCSPPFVISRLQLTSYARESPYSSGLGYPATFKPKRELFTAFCLQIVPLSSNAG